MKLPSLKSKGASTPGASLKPPQFLADLYADLRDRRLLPLIALLLVAIVAAPILLAGGDESESPIAATPSSPAPAARASFAVVPSEPALRDFRRRLGHRQARNPFKQPIAKAKPPAGGAGGSGGSPGGEGGGDAPGDSSVVVGGGTPGDGAVTTTTTNIVVQRKVIGYAIDTRAGFVDGNIQTRDGIEPTAQLPSKKNPVVIFVGLSKDKKRALFLMTSQVTAYYGKVHCAFDKQACQLVEIKPGKSATFAYGYGDSRYKLILKRIVPIVSTKEKAASVTATKGSANGGAEAGR